MAYTLTQEERETTIRFDPVEKVAQIYTSDPVYIRKLDALCADHPDEYHLVRRDEYGARYTAPAKLIRFGKPPSEARRELMRQNAQHMRKKLNGIEAPQTSADSDE